MSDTPITDAHARQMEGYADQWVSRHISEELERERDELRDKTVDALAKVAVLTEAADYLNGRLREVTAQRDGLLEMVARCEMWLSTLPEGRAMQLACRAAIAAVKGGQP